MECAFLLSLLGKDACICKGNKKYCDKQIFLTKYFLFLLHLFECAAKNKLEGLLFSPVKNG